MEDKNNPKSNLIEKSNLSIDVEPFVPKNFSKSGSDVISYEPPFYPQLFAPFGVPFTDLYSNIGFDDYTYYANPNPFPSSPQVYHQPDWTTTSLQPDFYEVPQPPPHTYQSSPAKPAKKSFLKDSHNFNTKDKNKYDRDIPKDFSRGPESHPPSKKYPSKKTERTFWKPKLNSLEEFPSLPNSDNNLTSSCTKSNSVFSSEASYSAKLKEIKPLQKPPNIPIQPDAFKDRKSKNARKKRHSSINTQESNVDKSKPLKEINLNGKNLKKEKDSLILNNTFEGKSCCSPDVLGTDLESETDKNFDASSLVTSASTFDKSCWNKDNRAFLKENRETHGKNIYKDSPDTKYSSKIFNKDVDRAPKIETIPKSNFNIKVEKVKCKNNIEKQNKQNDSSLSSDNNKPHRNSKQNLLQSKNLAPSNLETKFKKEISKWNDSPNTFTDATSFSKKPCNKNYANLKSSLDSPKKCTKETLKVALNSKGVDSLRKDVSLSKKIEQAKPLNVKKNINTTLSVYKPEISPSLPFEDPEEFPELGALGVKTPLIVTKNASSTVTRVNEQLSSTIEASSSNNQAPLADTVMPHSLEVKEEKKGENEKVASKAKESSKSSRTALELDFTNLLRMVAPKAQQKKKKEPRLLIKKQIPIKRPANILDSSAPLTKKGKERLTPKPKKPSPLKKIILLEKEEKKRLREQIRQQLEVSDIIPEEQDGLCPEPLSPEEILQDSLIQRVLADSVTRHQAAKVILHTRKFRDYCCHLPSSEVDKTVHTLLTDLLRFQDRAYQKDPIKAKSKRRVVYGLREITKHLKLRKLKAIIFATDIEKIDSQGGLTDNLTFIQALAQEQGVHCIYALKRSTLGHACLKKVPISCIGIFNYEGADKHFRKLIDMTHQQEEAYRNELSRIESLLTNELLQEFQNHSLHSLQFNQWINRTRLHLLQQSHHPQENKHPPTQEDCQEST